MARISIDMPALGFGQDTGRIAGWLKSVGDQIAIDEAIAEIETEKATVEMGAPASGTLVEIVAAVGDDVPVGQPICWVDNGR
jgi:pyruvate/2-oxoglutarate dehydrogenase complex dihydrolipoamide acyltransferase (E2) component